MLSHFHLYGELRFSRRRNSPSGLREDGDGEITFVALVVHYATIMQLLSTEQSAILLKYLFK